MPAEAEQLQLFKPKCPCLLVTVHKTQDLQWELALCRQCGKEVPDWETRKQPKGAVLVYRYVADKEALILLLENPPAPKRLVTDPPEEPAKQAKKRPVVDLELPS